MPLPIQVAAAARQKMQDLATTSPEGFVEVDTMLSAISTTGMIGGSHIAVLNHRLDVYILDPPSPGPDILALHDSAGLIVTDLLNPKSNILDNAKKQYLANHAAAATGIIPTNVHIL